MSRVFLSQVCSLAAADGDVGDSRTVCYQFYRSQNDNTRLSVGDRPGRAWWMILGKQRALGKGANYND